MLAQMPERKVLEAGSRFMASPLVLDRLVGVLFHSDNPVNVMGCILTLHKLSCSVFYQRVVDRVCATGGKGVYRLINNLPLTHQAPLPAISSHFLAQIACKVEGRVAMQTSGAVQMLKELPQWIHGPLEAGVSESSEAYLLLLRVMVWMCESANVDCVYPLSTSLTLTPDGLVESVYDSLMASMSRDERSVALSVEMLIQSHAFARILVFLVNPHIHAHLHHLPSMRGYIGAIILQKLATHAANEVSLRVPFMLSEESL